MGLIVGFSATTTMMKNESRRILFNDHVVTLDSSDVLVLRLHGVLRATDIVAYGAARNELLEGQRYLLAVLDMRGMTDIEPNVRKEIAATRDPRPQAIAALGGSFRFRVVSEMIVKAARFFANRNIHMKFFDDERSGRAWLEEMREVFRAE